MQKVFKVCSVIFAVIALLSLSVFNVCAASTQLYFNSENFDLYYCQVSRDNGATWVSPSSYTFSTLSNNWGHLNLSYPNGLQYPLLLARFDPLVSAGNFTVQPYMQLNCNLQYFQVYGSDQYASQTLSGAMYLVTPDGLIYEFPITYQQVADDNSFAQVTLGGTAEVGEGFDLYDCYIELRLKGLSNLGGVEIKFQNLNMTTKDYISEETVKIVESIDKGFADLQAQQQQNTQDIINNNNSNTDKIIGNQNSNTDKITDNQNANTDKITGAIGDATDEFLNGGNPDDDGAKDDFDEAVDDLVEAEENLFQGKTAEEWYDLILDALGGDPFDDLTTMASASVSAYINNLMFALGPEYSALIFLSCGLGIGLLALGRAI